MPGEYRFEGRSPGCSRCGHQFAVGEEYHSALMIEEVEVAPLPPGDASATGAEEGAGDGGVPAPAPGVAASADAGEGVLPFRRQDFCASCWNEEDPGKYFSCWRASVPEPGEDRRPLARRIDVETIYDMFRRLEGHADPVQQKFRFILALMLMRKKRFKFTGVVDSPHGEHLVLEDRDEGMTHKVLDPGLAEEEIDSLRSQIDRLLGGPEDEEAVAPASSGEAQETPGGGGSG